MKATNIIIIINEIKTLKFILFKQYLKFKNPIYENTVQQCDENT